MRYNIFILTLLMLAFSGMMAQSVFFSRDVIASGGETDQGASMLVSWTLGELAVETYKKNDLTLTQGFQQPSPDTMIDGIENDLLQLISLRAYPNPTSSTVWLEAQPDKPMNAYMELYNLAGHQYMKQEITLFPGNRIPVNLKGLATGVYLLRIISDEQKAAGSFRIQYQPW